MTILGIDPGTATTGFGIIKSEKSNMNLIYYDCIITSPRDSTAQRLKNLYAELEKIIKKYKPDIMAIEDLFFFKNLKTAIKVSQARGVIILAATNKNIPVYEYTPLQVKQAVTGYGRAEKMQVQKMIKIILNLKEIPKPDDAADALAVAICCANSYKLQ